MTQIDGKIAVKQSAPEHGEHLKGRYPEKNSGGLLILLIQLYFSLNKTVLRFYKNPATHAVELPLWCSKLPCISDYLDTMLWVAETHLRLLYIDCQPYKMKFSLHGDQCQRYTLSKNLCSKYQALVILRCDLLC